jgi:hypothetical protein
LKKWKIIILLSAFFLYLAWEGFYAWNTFFSPNLIKLSYLFESNKDKKARLAKEESLKIAKRVEKEKIAKIESAALSSLLNYVTPILETFDINKLKSMGVFPSVDEETKTIGKTFRVEETVADPFLYVSFLDHAFEGEIDIEYSYIDDDLYDKTNDLSNDTFALTFVKLKDDNDWKLVTYDGYTSEDSSSLPPEFHLYVRSKFNTISNIEYDKYELNFRKENTSQ